MKTRFYSLLILALFTLIYFGCSSSDSDPTGPALSPPSSPDSLQVSTLSESSVQLEWNDNSDNEEGFQIVYSSINSFEIYYGMGIEPDTTSAVITNLDPLTEYFFRICAYNDDGDSDFSNLDSATTLDQTEYIPAAPTALSVTMLSDTELTIVWNDNSDNELGFELEYSTSSSFDEYYGIELIANLETFIVDQLDPSTEYFFRIYAYNNNGDSDLSTVESATTDISAVNTPTAPDGLSLTVYSSSEIRAEWNDNSDDEENFVLQWSTTSDFSVEYSATIPLNTENFTVTGLNPSTQYYFRVLAENSYGNSNWTTTESASTIQTVYGDFSINSGSYYINSRSITLNNSMTGVTLMQFRDDNSGWTSAMTYSSTYSYTLTYGDGMRTVYARYYDSAGNLYERSEEISLDTVAPDIDSFKINDGDFDTYNSTVTLHNDVVGATKMRFSFNGASWPNWEDFRLTKTFTIPEVEDTYQYAYAQFKDDHDNIVSAQDYIMFDKMRTVEIRTWSIYVDKAGDGGGTGEIYWEFRGENNETGENFDISVIDREDYISMPENTSHMVYDQYNPHVNSYSTTVTRGESGNYIRLFFRIWDNDGASVYDDDATGSGTTIISESDNWYIGQYYNYVFDDESQAITGYIRFICQEVD